MSWDGAMNRAVGDPFFLVARYCPKNAKPIPIPNEEICDTALGPVYEAAVFLIVSLS
ncbi:MAG: hypothetical protein WB988_25835 [Candidatus Nitrosopolaris sp.]|jgi:hypothetical protein